MTIADVCAACNNGPLAALDAYVCRLYDQYFYRFHDGGSELLFCYDWSLLGNWLLKASYNAARAAGNKRDIEILARFAEFIRGEDLRQPDIAIWLDLVAPSYLAVQSDCGLFAAEKLMPEMTRLATVTIPDACLQEYTLRMVAINSFYFYLAIPTRPYVTPCMPELIQICGFFRLIAQLDPELACAKVKTTGLEVQHIIVPHILQHEGAYRTYMESQGMA